MVNEILDFLFNIIGGTISGVVSGIISGYIVGKLVERSLKHPNHVQYDEFLKKVERNKLWGFEIYGKGISSTTFLFTKDITVNYYGGKIINSKNKYPDKSRRGLKFIDSTHFFPWDSIAFEFRKNRVDGWRIPGKSISGEKELYSILSKRISREDFDKRIKDSTCILCGNVINVISHRLLDDYTFYLYPGENDTFLELESKMKK